MDKKNKKTRWDFWFSPCFCLSREWDLPRSSRGAGCLPPEADRRSHARQTYFILSRWPGSNPAQSFASAGQAGDLNLSREWDLDPRPTRYPAFRLSAEAGQANALLKFLSRWWDLNPQPTVYDTVALPVELSRPSQSG